MTHSKINLINLDEREEKKFPSKDDFLNFRNRQKIGSGKKNPIPCFDKNFHQNFVEMIFGDFFAFLQPLKK